MLASDLARLVDEQRVELLVELLTRKQPSRAADQWVRGKACIVVVGRRLDDGIVRRLPVRDLLDDLQF
jgi:hypothetical protein